MLAVKRLKINHEKDPLGIPGKPEFSWELESDRRNVMQKAYRLQIAVDPEFADVRYDSGMAEDGDSAHVCPELDFLEPARKYYARVQADDGTEASEWSGTAFFVTAPGADGWKAPFISAENEASYKTCSRGTYLRGTFEVKGPVREAYAYTTALGLYNFFLNGQKAGTDEMAPGWTSYRKNLLYQTCDVTGLLHEGTNAAGAMLAAGWYKGVMGLTKARNNYGDRTAFAMQLVIRYEDGSVETVCTGTGWKGCDSPVVFSEIYDGETYDAHLEVEGWAEPEEPGGDWHETEEVPFDWSVLHPQYGARVKMMDRLPAQQIFVTPKGETVVDFGQNLAGRIHVTACGKPGDVIELRCFESLDSEGNVYFDNLRKAKTTMKYIFAEEKEVTWHPRFTYMGFRYAKIISFPGSPAKEDFTAYTLHSEMERTGELETSNPLLNQLHHNILWGMKGNFLDVPTDCPQRDERLGWTADAQIFSRTASYLMDTDTFFRKWLCDLKADQRPDGGVPHVIPNIEEGREEGNWLLSQSPHSAAAWADAAVIIPWNLYLMYGDKEVLRQQYGSMKGWIDFMTAHSVDHQWTFMMQLGDWVALDAEEGSYFGATPTELICDAYYAYSTDLFVKTAEVLGNEADAAAYRELREQIVKKFQETWFDGDGKMRAQTQTAHIVALHFGLTPEAYIQQTAQRLRELLEKEDGHLVTGFVGTPYFCLALSESGCLKEAYDLLLKEDFPSWLYQVKKGATTVWEHWDGLKPDGTMWSADMNSFNHYAYGAVGEWMYRVMAGLDTDEARPGFRHMVCCPRIGGGLSYVKGSYHSSYGEHRIEWRTDGDCVTMSVNVPPNTTATIRLDGAKSVSESDGLDFTGCDGCMEAEAGSGSYTVKFTR